MWAQLRWLSINCDFIAHLDDVLRNRFVCSLRSEAMQKRILSIKELKLQDVDTAQAVEIADNSTKALQGPEPVPVHQVSKNRSRSGLARNSAVQKRTASVPCYRCGKSNHASSSCRFIEATCHYCQKKGHIAKVCRSKQRGLPPRTPAAASATMVFTSTSAFPMVSPLHPPYSRKRWTQSSKAFYG